REAERLLAAQGVAVEPVATQRAGHATELARDLAREGRKTVLVLGGDGTLSEAANGILGLPAAKRPTLGFLPGGTGNDFLRDFAIKDLGAAARLIAAGKTVAVDAVDVRWPGGSHFSINLVGSGLAAKAGARFGKSFRWVGPKGYDIAAAIEIATMKACPTRLVLDGKDFSGDLPLVIAMNSVHTGGAMRMAPDAKPTDGLLDVVTVQDIGKLEIMNLLATKVRKGLHVDDPHVTIRRAAKVHIGPEDPSPLLLDGEIIGNTPVDLTVLPGAFRLLA
ncbi:MAG TPA: diacylglycerol kinase family protein, partial [Candidatus Thermoplasmatota archaeon]|nr:diacylglycerol kinase family protein [Candidatus Thermoplasmatota archaeon]